MLNIEWPSDFRKDGTKRNYRRPSTFHGWIAKLRGTLIGNEELRTSGIREMKAAKRFNAKVDAREQAKALKRDQSTRSTASASGFVRRDSKREQPPSQLKRSNTAPSRRPSTSRAPPSSGRQQQPQRQRQNSAPAPPGTPIRRSSTRTQGSNSRPSGGAQGAHRQPAPPTRRSTGQSVRRPSQSRQH